MQNVCHPIKIMRHAKKPYREKKSISVNRLTNNLSRRNNRQFHELATLYVTFILYS